MPRFEFGKVDVNRWQWVNDQWLVASLGAEEKYGDGSLYITRLAGLNAADGRIVKIDWKHSGLDADNILWVAGDGSPHVVFSKQTSIEGSGWAYSVFDADVSTGEARLVQSSKADIYRWFADGAGHVRIQAMRDYHSGFLGGYVSSHDYWAKQAPHLAVVSPRMHAKEFGEPTLLLHGKEDVRVPVNQSRSMANQLRKASKSYEYIELPEADHNLSRTEDRAALLKVIKAFLDRYNPA